MLVGTSVLLTTALQQTAEEVSFSSPTVLTLLVFAFVFFAGFLTWQWFIATSSWNLDPIFSWNFITNRMFIAGLCNSWLSGMVTFVTIVQIPQRFMLVNSLSVIDAGVRLIPFAAVMALTSVLLSILLMKSKLPAILTLMIGAFLEVAGVVGLSQASASPQIQPSQYGFQTLSGIGIGTCNVILVLLTPYVVEKREFAVGNGAVSQFRIFGGSLGLSIVTSATHPALRASLLQILSLEEIKSVLDRTDRILMLSPEKQGLVRERFGHMYNNQMIIMTGIAAAQVLATVLQWQRKAIVLRR